MSPSIDVLWVLLAALLVFLMQAGFLGLESGFTRNKNNINVAIKNIADFTVSTLLFWAFGFALMFGATRGGLTGTTDFFLEFESSRLDHIVFFIFQVMFCGTAVTIISGAIAERVHFGGYMLVSAVVAGAIYPIFGHWSWNGIETGVTSGWLNSAGFVDFAGSTVVHSVGGWVSLAMLVIIGPRQGRFNEAGEAQHIPASNLTIATTGVMLLWFGWFGFNGGSALAFNDQAIRALLNTIMAGSSGLVGALFLSLAIYRRADVGMLLNGTLAGLVGITANAHAVSIVAAVLIGMIAVVFMFATQILLERLRIDDAVGAVPVHLGAGVWGTLAVAIFGQPELLGTGLSQIDQLVMQTVGILVCGVWTFSTMLLFTALVNWLTPLRVSPEDEYIGLNVSEHNARTDLLDLFEAMDEQARTGNLEIRAPVEPFTEVGRIANRYNYVISSLQQALARADAIVRTARDAIVTFTIEDGRIVSANPIAEQLFKYEVRQLRGEVFWMLLATVDAQSDFLDMVSELIMQDHYTETMARRSDGTTFPVEVSITQFEQGQAALFAATFRDISLRKEIEQERQQTREREIKTQMALENARLKSEFLSTVSHELRTPLNSMIGYSGLLLMGVKGQIDSEARSVVSNLEDSSRHLLMLVNDILDIDKMESGHFHLEVRTVEIQPLARSWVEQMRLLAENKGLDIRVEIPPDFPATIMGDPDRLTQIALNLLSNAIKFTEMGWVELRLSFGTHFWRIEVSDSGIGIHPRDQTIIFEKFRQSDGSYSRQHGGTGLGLAIVKQLAQAMGGDVHVVSKLGQGTTFTVILPRRIT